MRDTMRLIGVDEAGRGPVLGPLVVGLLSIPKEDEHMLEEQCIEDSKHVSHAKRKKHYEWLNQQADERGWYVDTIICQPNRIDNAVYAKGLNILEVDLFSAILNRHHREFQQNLEILLDACDEKSLGGTGNRVPIELLLNKTFKVPWILAGGISAEIIPEIFSKLRPDGIDASSRLEISPGIKDIKKVESLVREIRKET